MWRSKNDWWSPGIFRCVAPVVLALLMVHGAASAPAAGTGGAGGPGPNPLQITISFPQLAITGGDFEIGKVELSQPAPQGGAKVTITSDTTDVKTSPMTAQSLSVPAGATSVSFKAITSAVGKTEVATLTAAYSSASGSVKLSLEPNGVSSVSMQPATVNWGGSASGAIQLKSPAPNDVPYFKNLAPQGAPANYLSQVRKGGATVTLNSSNSSVTVPASVKVPSGGTYAKFTATVSPPSSCSAGTPGPTTATITATWEMTASGSLNVGQNNGNKPGRYTSQTVRIDPKTILGVSHDAHALVLQGSDKCVQTLKAGNVMFLKHLGVLKVVKVMVMKTLQKQIAVAVSSASLTDFINDGTFQVFSQKLGPASEPSGAWKQGLEPDQPESGDDQWKYKVSGSGNTYSFTAFKQKGGLSASVSGKGEMANADYNFLAVIHGDKLQQANFKVPTDGTMDVNWLVQTTAAGQGIGESRLRLPALHSGLVDSADDIPLLFQVYANLIFKPGFGEKAAAKGHFKITFTGEGGIDGATPLNEGLDAKTDITSTTSSALAPQGVVAAINAPKFALSLSTVSFLWALQARLPGALNSKGADLADSMQSQLGAYAKPSLDPPHPGDLFRLKRAAYVMWVSSVAYAGSGLLGVGLMSSVPCQQYYQTFLAQAGMDKDMLGSISGSVPPKHGVEVFKKEKTTLIPAIKGCEPKK